MPFIFSGEKTSMLLIVAVVAGFDTMFVLG
jgi:hypothetical protein